MADGHGSSGDGPATSGAPQRKLTSAARLKEKGKKLAAAHIHRELAVNGQSDSLHRLLDDLLSPERLISNAESIEWCRWLVAGGRTPAEFASIVRAYDNHAKCGLVWIPHVVAYRCRTCGISPCMSICRDCFKRGNHENHDFNMFLSQAGGACDCGDTSVMKAEGFCSDHGINNCQNKSPVPDDLMLVAEAMMPRLILRMLLHFREFSAINHDSADCRRTAEYCNDYCSMLMEFNNMGELMRRVMTKTLIDRGVYRRLLEPPYPSSHYGEYLRDSWRRYDEALRQFPSPEPPHDYRHLTALGRTIVHETLLEEFIFWTFKYEFQQQIVCFLLNMLPDQDYKEHLTRTFVMHYCRIPSVLELSNDPDTLSNRVVHMSVQLFSNESLALKMVEELSLLHVMIISLRQMMSKILTPHTLHNPVRNFHYVVDCAERVMKEHCYWPLVSDFNNVLSHESVALVFLKDDDLIDMWFQFLSMLQGMNVNIREIISHVEYESSSYYAAFSCELEASAYPMWSIISHLRDPSHAPLAKKIMMYCVNYLQDWLDAVNFCQNPKFEKYEMSRASFHFPLHRYLAAFICQGVKTMGMSLNDILPSADLLPMLMMHPLRVQSLFYEILSGVWVRNGLQIKGQAMTYIQANFCNSMVDMDLFFLQICATQLPPNHFLGECIAIFGVEDWLGLSLISASPGMEQDSMLEGLLTFLATLITSRINLGNDETTQCIIEISALLATGDKTHSQLLELMPERSGNAHTRNFERYLRELSIYRSPPVGSENLEQGMFMPVPAVWERHYDPLHVLLRAVHRRDFQNSLDRFGAYVKQAGKMPPSGNLWPPFRMPGSCGPAYSDPGAVLGSRILHATILVIFYRAVHTHSVSEHMLALAVFLLEMAVSAAGAAGGEAATSRSTVGDSGDAGGSTSSVDSSAHAGAEASGGSNAREPAVPDLLNCYPSNCLSDNLRMQVKRISPLPTTRRSPVSYHKPLDGGSSPPFDSDVEWDLSEDETLMMIGSSADTLEGDAGGVARAAGAISGEGNRVAGVRMTELVPSSRAGTEVVPLSQDLAVLAHRVAIHAPPLPSSTASQMVVEEEEDEEHGDDDEDDEDGEPDGDEGGDAYGNRALEDELRRRRLWRLRYRSRQQEAPVQESQDADMLYHVMDEDDDVMVEDGSLRNPQQQQVVLARAAPRAHEHQQTHHQHHHPPVQMMMMEESRRRRFSGGNANVVLPADVVDYIIDVEDDDDDDDEEEVNEEGDDGEVEEEEDEYVDVEGLPGEERGQGDGDDGEAIMNAVIQSIVPRVSEVPPRRGLAGAHQQLIGQLGHATTTRQPVHHHHHRTAPPVSLLNHHHHHHRHRQQQQQQQPQQQQQQPQQQQPQDARADRTAGTESSGGASETGRTVATTTGIELLVRHEFVAVPREEDDEDEEEEEEEIVRELVDGGAPRVQRNRQRRQEIAIPARAPTPPVIASRASVGGLLLPLTRVQPMGADEPRPPSGGGGAQAEGGLNVVAHQQTQLQNYYAVATHHHHHHHHQHQHHHHHRHRHHHNHHAEGTGVATGQQPGQQQPNPQSLQQQTPRHYRSLQGGPGQHGPGSTGPGGHQAPLWMRFRRRRNLAVSRQRNSVGPVLAAAPVVQGLNAPAAAGDGTVGMASTGSEMAPRDSVGGRGGANAPGDGSTGSGGSQSAGTTPCNSIVLEESIISLLLKLHSQLSGALDSFSLEDETDGALSAGATATAGCSSQPYPSTSSGGGGGGGGGGTTGKHSGHSQMMELDEPAAEGGSSSQQAAAKAGVSSPGRTSESRIGDGPFFIGNLLRKIAALDESCASRIDEIRKQLWPNQRERQAEQKAREAREKEERTKRAKERQKKMMEEFANRQKRFMQMAMAEMAGGGSGGDSSGMDACCDDEGEEPDAERRQEERAREQQAEAEAVHLREKEYTCIICNTSAPSTESNPIGLVVLVESSSVVGHRRTRSERLSLPLGAEDRIALEQSVTLAGEFSRRIELLQWKFGPTSWFLSHNIGWEGGVHIQSCGHHVHLSCHDAYLRSLHTPRSPNNLNVELGEFFCPVCRQLANSVLPLSPALDRPAPLIRSPTPPHRTLVLELIGLFQESKRTPMASKFSEAMGRAMGNITACTQRNIKRYPVTLQSLFSFVISIARTNLEAEIIQRGGSLCTGSTDDVRYKPKRDCIVPLLHVLSLHVRLMINDDWPIRFKVGDDWPWHSWSRLAGIQLSYDAGRDTSDIGRQPKAARPPSGSDAGGSLPADPVQPVRAPATQHNDELESDLAMAVVPSTGSGTAGRRRSHEDDSDEDDEDDDDDDEDGVLCRLRRVASSIRGMLLPPPRSPGDEPLGNDALHSIVNNRRQAASASAIATGATEPTGAAGAPGAVATSSTKTTAATAASSIVDTETIPDLISDPTALMLKFILLAPLHLDQAYFTCIVKVMYNLLYYQIVLQLCTHLTDEECDEILACYNEQKPAARIVKERGVPHIGVAMAFVLGQLDRCRHIRSDSILMGGGSPSSTSNDASLSTPCAGTSAASSNSASAMDVGSGSDTPTATNRAKRVNLDVLEKKLQRLCLPFLRVAALLRHHIYHAEIPDIAGPHLEFARLVYFLELVTVSMDWDKFNASKALCFLPGTELALPKNWCDQLRNLRPTYESTRSLIVKQHIEWRQPRLLGLPREYERLFTYYHEQPCQKCKNVPKESSICLLCGTIVCIKQTCCKEQDCCEAVRHSISCGGGTGIFLVITSTYIIVIRGHRACLWGSLYLDDYDEEDRDLKRGKPLYLSEDRFNLLESQWLSHRFAHTKHNWVWHRDSL